MVLTSCICTDIVLLLATIAFLLRLYFNHAFSYWKTRNVPTSVPPTIPFGNTGNPRTRKDPQYITTVKCYNHLKSEGHRYGGLYLSLRPAFVAIDPELIKNIMSKDFAHFNDRGMYLNRKGDPLNANLFFECGARWKNLRTKLTPTFTSGKMKMMFSTLVECTKPLVGEIAKLVDEKQALDIKDLSRCYTTDVIGSCAFGLDCNSFKLPESEFRKYGKKIFAPSLWRAWAGTFVGIFPKLALKLGIRFSTDEVNEFFIGAIKSTIQHREETGLIRNDFLQLMLNLQQTGALKEEEIAPQAYVFFLAGFETSSTTITYCLYELAKHEDLQNKLREEIKEKVQGELTYDVLHELKLVSQTVDETLRMYPVLPNIARKCTEKYKVPESDLMIEKGSLVLIPVYALHHDPEYYPDPEKFDPDRFSDSNKSQIHNFTYLPFGEGPKNCIGLRFGLMQTKVALVSILSKFKVRLNPKTPTSLTWNTNAHMLLSKETVYLDLEQIS